MKLPFLKKLNKKPIPLYYLVLMLRDEKAHAVIFEEIHGKVRIIGQKEQYFSTEIDDVPFEELLDAMDKVISSAESSLPRDIQTQKTIFGVKESWTDNEQIKKDHLMKLKKASDELGLTPIGFLVTSQAVSHLLQKEEGVPVSAILVEVNEKSVTVTLFRAGKNIGSKSSKIHDSVSFTVDTLLKHFDVAEIFPSRIIIFNGEEDFSQEFTSHSWSKSLPFLHLPQITSLPYGFDVKSILYGAATQLGLELLEKDIPKEHIARPEVFEDTQEDNEEHEETAETSELYDDFEEENFGFAKGVDVAIQKPAETQEAEEEKEEEEREEEIIPEGKTEEKSIEFKPDKKRRNPLASARHVLAGIVAPVSGLLEKLNIKRKPQLPSNKLKFIAPAILLLVITAVISYFMFLKATITIIIDPKTSEQTKSITFSTEEETSPEDGTIKGEFISVSEEGSVSTAATGKKDVGTPAKGTVTIFNSMTEKQTLEKGTIIKSSNGLEFALDASITIDAVASHSADETVSPKTANVSVTADQLGKESNLPSGTKFSVNSFETSDLIAKNDNPFSGGTKSQITVVSSNDIDKAEEKLIKELENKARENLQKKLDKNKVLLPSFASEEITKESPNAEVGEEESQLTLKGTVKYQGIFYNKNDLLTFSEYFLSKDNSDQEIDSNNIKVTVLDIKTITDSEVDAKLNIKSSILPRIDENEIIKSLKGKSFEFANDYIKKLPQIKNVEIKLSPNILFLPKKLPSKENNIKIVSETNS